MIRRDFIGSVLGTYMAARLPLIAQATQKIDESLLKYRLKRIESLGTDKLKKFNILYHLNGTKVLGTPVKEYEPGVWTFQELNITQKQTYHRISILDDQGFEITHSAFSDVMPANPGDVLKMSYVMDMEYLKANADDWQASRLCILKG